MQQRELHVRGDLLHQAPVLAQNVAGAADQGVVRGALLQRLQHLAPAQGAQLGMERLITNDSWAKRGSTQLQRLQHLAQRRGLSSAWRGYASARGDLLWLQGSRNYCTG